MKNFITTQGQELNEARARLSTVEAANARYESPETDLREGPWTQGKERQRQQLQLEHQQLKQQVVSLEGEVQELIRERATLVDDLLGPDSTSLESRLAKANSQVGELRQELAEQRGAVTSLLEDLANGCAPMQGWGNSYQAALAVNAERAHVLKWAELKCKELGIEWPIKPIPYAGNLPSEPAAPLLEEAVPSARRITCIHDGCLNEHVHDGHCSCYLLGVSDTEDRQITSNGDPEPWRAVFPTQEAYDASVQSVVERIEGGEIQPREPDEDECESTGGAYVRCKQCGGPLYHFATGLCAEHYQAQNGKEVSGE